MREETKEVMKKIQTEVQVQTDDGAIETVTVTPEMNNRFQELTFMAHQVILSSKAMLAQIFWEIKERKLYAAGGYKTFAECVQVKFGISYRQAADYISMKEQFPLLIEKAEKDPLGEEAQIINGISLKKISDLSRSEKGKQLINTGTVILDDGTELTLADFQAMSAKEQNDAISEIKKERNKFKKQVELLEKENKKLHSDLKLNNNYLEEIGGEEGLARARRIQGQEACLGALARAQAIIHEGIRALREVDMHDPEVENEKKSIFEFLRHVLDEAERDWENFVTLGLAEKIPGVED
jgi:hypothetical protein